MVYLVSVGIVCICFSLWRIERKLDKLINNDKNGIIQNGNTHLKKL